MIENQKTIETQYLIVGAGPAGLIAGIGLLNLGFKVQIVDQLKQQIRPLCGEYLSPEGVDYIKRMGLDDCLDGFNHLLGMTLFSAGGSKVCTSFPDKSYGLSLNRETFQTRLSKKFESMNGIIHYDNTLEEILSHKDGYQIITPKLIINTKYLIGADGRMSKVARILEFKTDFPGHKKVAIHCYLKSKKPQPPLGQMHILPNGSYIGINPIVPEEVNFSMVTDQKALKAAGGPRELINFWLKESSFLSEQFYPLILEEIKTISPITRKSIEITKGNAVLIGDASGFIDPLTGEGITTAVKTAFMLCEEIKNEANIKEALLCYDYRRKNDFIQKERLNRVFQKLIYSKFCCEVLGLTLNLSKKLRDTFIGVIGNVYTPGEALRLLVKIYLTERF